MPMVCWLLLRCRISVCSYIFNIPLIKNNNYVRLLQVREYPVRSPFPCVSVLHISSFNSHPPCEVGISVISFNEKRAGAGGGPETSTGLHSLSNETLKEHTVLPPSQEGYLLKRYDKSQCRAEYVQKLIPRLSVQGIFLGHFFFDLTNQCGKCHAMSVSFPSSLPGPQMLEMVKSTFLTSFQPEFYMGPNEERSTSWTGNITLA